MTTTSKIAASTKLTGFYTNGGMEFETNMYIHGILVNGTSYGSVKEAMKANDCKNLGQFQELDPRLDAEDINEHTGDLTGERGDWYYMYSKRWVRGSGCDVLHFREFVAQ